ncbi:phosphatase PAP2 family protein [Desertivirga brevis]|uniref:phosphatase PAP2 family protein n=1 Tax=Desertivirga brevis TaxID=2810310 RepID=UPI001A962F0C|nr:phosphatase PAP2 family protein [Pedobacter sp. SYSU D00873]
MKKRFIRFFYEQQSFFFAFATFCILGIILQLSFNQEQIFLYINRHHCAFFDRFFLFYTWLGDGLFVVFISLLLSFYKFRYSILSLMAYLYSSLIAQLLKYQFSFPRPLKYFEGKESLHLISGLDVHSYKSFPSGHSVSALALAIILAYISPNKRLGGLIFIVYLIAAFSRVYLAEHFFMDIFAGAFLGVVLAIQMIFWLEGRKWYNSSHLDFGWNKRIARKGIKKRDFDITLIERSLFEKR